MSATTPPPEDGYGVILSDTDIPGHPSGMYGVVNDDGVIAWATSSEQAHALIGMLSATTPPPYGPVDAARDLLNYMQMEDMNAVMVQDDAGNRPSYGYDSDGDMIEDDDVNHAIGWLATGLVVNSTPGEGWNPHVTRESLEDFLGV